MSVQIDGSTGNIIAIKADYSGNVSIGGTLTYEDVTNVDSVGIVTARTGLKVLAGGANVVGVVTASGADINSGHIVLDSGYSLQWSDSHERIEQSDGKLEFFTNNTEKVTISGGNIGIGENSPDRLLHLKAASSTAYSGGSDTADYNLLKIENTTDDKSAGIFFQIGSNGEAAITATEVADGNADICFQNRGGGVRSEKVRIDSAGVVKLTQSGNNPRYGSLEASGDAFKLKAFSGNASHNATMQFFTGADSPAERMRLDSGGSLGIGVNNPGDYHADAHDLVLASGMTIANTTQGHIFFADSSTGTGEYVAQINYDHTNDRFNIVANNTTCIRIRSTGGFENYSTSTNIDLSNSQSAGTTYEFIYARHSSTALANGTLAFKVTNNGNVSNTNNSYGSLSDQRLKENIVDATSQWDDIKGLQIRKYNFRENTGYETHTQIGLIAQEAESVSPGLVETFAVKEDETVLDADGNELDSIKSINYSVLYMKAVKALQEAQTRIETLETKVAALEG